MRMFGGVYEDVVKTISAGSDRGAIKKARQLVQEGNDRKEIEVWRDWKEGVTYGLYEVARIIQQPKEAVIWSASRKN